MSSDVDRFLDESADVLTDWEGSVDSASWSADGSHQPERIEGGYYGFDRRPGVGDLSAALVEQARREQRMRDGAPEGPPPIDTRDDGRLAVGGPLHLRTVTGTGETGVLSYMVPPPIVPATMAAGGPRPEDTFRPEVVTYHRQRVAFPPYVMEVWVFDGMPIEVAQALLFARLLTGVPGVVLRV